MAVFGRDSLLTSFQALTFAPELAASTLRALALLQARTDDPFRDEEPGKILHEIRLGEMTAFEERPALALLRRRRRDDAVPDPARGVRALDGRHGAGARPRTRVPRGARPGSTSTATATRTATSNTSGATRRPASTTSAGRIRGTRSRSTDGTLAPTPRATCELQGYVYDAKRRTARAGARGVGRSALGRQAGARGRGAQDALQQGLLDRRARLLRARARRQEAPGRFADLQHRPPAVERDRRRRQGRGLRQAPDERRAVLGLGDPHHGGQRRVVQPDRLPRRHGLAARQLVRRLGPAPLRLRRGGGTHLPRASSRRPTCSTAACPRRSAATRAARPTTRSSTRPRAARRPGRPARRCWCCARCSASTRTANT